MRYACTCVQGSHQLGKYRLIIELAQGGMGCVYLAVQQGLAGFNKLAVVKELKPSLAEEHGFLEMFLDEARLSARLNHPNVVQTNDVAIDQGRAYIAMEYLDGQSLVRMRARLTRAGMLPLAMHLRILAEACHGLHHAHELRDFDGTPLGVVHRDVSPHNVFVTYDGQVKLMDFGVAKALSSSHETTAGVVKGKVAYMAPEQVAGDPVDRRADVFSVGVMIWEAVANKRMWDQMRVETIIARIMVGDIPRIVEAAPGAPPKLVALIDRATARRPEDRHPDVEALRVELEACIADLGGGEPSVLRELGRAMADAFAQERAQINEAVQTQLRVAAAASPSQSVTVVALAQPPTGSFGALPATGPISTSSPNALPRLVQPLDVAGGSGKTAASMALAASRPPPAAAPQPKTGLFAALGVLAIVLLAGAAIGVRQLVVARHAPEETNADPTATGTATATATTTATATPTPTPTPQADAGPTRPPATARPTGPAVHRPPGKKGGGPDDDDVGF